MPESFTRRVAIVREFLDSIGNLDFDRVAQLLTEDAVMSLPFLPDLPPTWIDPTDSTGLDARQVW